MKLKLGPKFPQFFQLKSFLFILKARDFPSYAGQLLGFQTPTRLLGWKFFYICRGQGEFWRCRGDRACSRIHN